MVITGAPVSDTPAYTFKKTCGSRIFMDLIKNGEMIIFRKKKILFYRFTVSKEFKALWG
jgi:hypothetical protein